MESALTTHRVIEYPADLSGCNLLEFGSRQLLYLCSKSGETPFTVILGFFSGQKQDIITKDLIEPVSDDNKAQIREAVRRSCPPEYSGGSILFF